ncbi:MAG: hypothetical protein KBT06_09295 [Prevotellaceae bacterium]|nr:hypothetical protein [Candidatus Colivivens equi]MCQ2075827.1 DUF4834 family protein [Bacteroidaceae bacterium]
MIVLFIFGWVGSIVVSIINAVKRVSKKVPRDPFYERGSRQEKEDEPFEGKVNKKQVIGDDEGEYIEFEEIK